MVVANDMDFRRCEMLRGSFLGAGKASGVKNANPLQIPPPSIRHLVPIGGCRGSGRGSSCFWHWQKGLTKQPFPLFFAGFLKNNYPLEMCEAQRWGWGLFRSRAKNLHPTPLPLTDKDDLAVGRNQCPISLFFCTTEI